ncbi:MAG: hypothetical protein DRG87_00665 [Deltaproteobacteria bacterium]|nr:TRL-like family protein [Deltaproteobacteria bacterium]MBW2077073.1 TRL-like family protein [Deltaproteobacteria bacterium]MBW2310238.1 TRL-like family protein [Deltaproteobacteria bacterium]RLB32049.1 MAG: hypothetical protein DRG87_00665 [Deltaproteobacteria bacterium]
MRKRAFKFLLFVAVLGVLFCYGCGVVYTNVQTPMPTINLQANAASQTKAGKATCYTYVWVVTVGDCSVATAMKNGGLTKIHHIDTEIKSILGGIYARHTIMVYGE